MDHNQCPTESLRLREAGPEDGHINANGSQRPLLSLQNVHHRKRGVMHHEPADVSPRAVRARRHDQEADPATKRTAPWAISRRCSYVEQNVANMQMQPWLTRVDSWGETSLGETHQDASTLRVRAQHMPADREQVGPLLGGAPLPTPVRNQRSMGIQTNRDSIIANAREHKEEISDASGDEQSTLTHRGRRALGDVSSRVNSDRRAIMGNRQCTDNITKGSVLRELSYPTQASFEMSSLSQDLLQNCKATAFHSASQGQMALGLALQAAVKDEFGHLDAAWGLVEGAKGQKDKLAQALKKIAHGVQKACMLKSLAPKFGQAISAAPAASSEERCAQLENQIAAADERIAAYKEALQRPAQPQGSGAPTVLADLSDRLAAIDSASGGINVPGMAAFEQKVDQCIQGLVVANTCSQHLFQQCQDEYKSLQERNREFCPRAGGSQEPLKILSAIQ